MNNQGIQEPREPDPIINDVIIPSVQGEFDLIGLRPQDMQQMNNLPA